MSNDVATMQPFSVLFVCTANQCRSPLAENMFRAALAGLDVDWVVSSAGVRSRDGDSMHVHASAVLDERNILHEGWRTRRLTPQQVAAADLVLTAEVAHRKVAVTMHPAAIRYSFTLLQFARLLSLADEGQSDPQSGQDLIHHAELARSRPQSRDEHLIDLADPIGEAIDKFRTTADRIDDALRVIERALRPASANIPVS
jgi:protein-tyrosine phosphatase